VGAGKSACLTSVSAIALASRQRPRGHDVAALVFADADDQGPATTTGCGRRARLRAGLAAGWSGASIARIVATGTAIHLRRGIVRILIMPTVACETPLVVSRPLSPERIPDTERDTAQVIGGSSARWLSVSVVFSDIPERGIEAESSIQLDSSVGESENTVLSADPEAPGTSGMSQ